jgi:hypothetical protein
MIFACCSVKCYAGLPIVEYYTDHAYAQYIQILKNISLCLFNLKNDVSLNYESLIYNMTRN